MNRRFGMLMAVVSLAFAPATFAAFTYQGYLDENGVPADGVYDFEFRLFTGEWPFGFIVGSPVAVNDVDVVDGYFTVKLEFGNVFPNGGARWLDISVRPGAASGSYTILSPRQELTPAPYASALNLPYSASSANAAPLFTLDQSGAGSAMVLQSGSGDCLDVSADAGGDAVYAQTAGTGSAVSARTTGAGHALYGQTHGGGTAVYGYSLGTSGRAGFFRTESQSNASHALETQSNGTGMGIKAGARANYAGYFENTNAANTATTLRIETNGAGSAVWGKTTGTGSGGRFEISNATNSNPALDVRTTGTGPAAKFTGGNVEVGGELYAETGTVLNRATPIAWGTLYPNAADPELVTSSGNVTVSYVSGWGMRVQVIGEGDPANWTVIATPRYGSNPDHDYEITLKVGAPLSVAGQPGTGVFYITARCTNGCNEFVPPSWYNFVVYKGQ